MKSKNGFTLVELLAVIVILAILAGAAFTLVIPRIEKAKKETFINEARTLVDASMPYFLSNEKEKSVSIDVLFNNGYVSVKNTNSNFTGKVSIVNGVYYINVSNGKYRTEGLVSVADLNDNNVTKGELINTGTDDQLYLQKKEFLALEKTILERIKEKHPDHYDWYKKAVQPSSKYTSKSTATTDWPEPDWKCENKKIYYYTEATEDYIKNASKGSWKLGYKDCPSGFNAQWRRVLTKDILINEGIISGTEVDNIEVTHNDSAYYIYMKKGGLTTYNGSTYTSQSSYRKSCLKSTLFNYDNIFKLDEPTVTQIYYMGCRHSYNLITA